MKGHTMEQCTLCPRNCRVDRSEKLGFCGMGDTLKLARAALHHWEEPCISGTQGSGALFFSGCTLRCAYCQNHSLSHQGHGKEISVQRLAEIFRSLYEQGAHNLNFVTATPFVPQVLEALEIYRPPIPIVWNCSGYEAMETLKMLEGKVDIYLPDLKYSDAELAQTLSGTKNYFSVAKLALKEMVRQTGAPRWDGEKLVRGTVVRHLILPGQVENSLRCLDWLGDHFKPGEILVSLMRQYTPMEATKNMPPLDRRITDEEYDAVLSWMYLNGLEGFVQEGEAADAAFIPDF